MRSSRARQTGIRATPLPHEYGIYSDDDGSIDDDSEHDSSSSSGHRYQLSPPRHQSQQQYSRQYHSIPVNRAHAGEDRYLAEAKTEPTWRRERRTRTRSTSQDRDRDMEDRGDKWSDPSSTSTSMDLLTPTRFLNALERVSLDDIDNFYSQFNDEELSKCTSALSLVASKVEEAKRLSIQQKEKDLAASKLSSEENSLCCICRDATKTILLLPCRHLCLCEDCSVSLQQRRGSCPVCRETVRDTLRVYA